MAAIGTEDGYEICFLAASTQSSSSLSPEKSRNKHCSQKKHRKACQFALSTHPFEDLKSVCDRNILPQDIVDFTDRRLVMVGMGSIGRACLPILFHSLKGLESKSVYVFSNAPANEIIASRFGVHFRLVSLTAENYEEELLPLLRPNDFLLNVSVNVSSKALVQLCQKARCLYLDTCIEPWEGGYDDPNLSITDRSNAIQRKDALTAADGLHPPLMTAVYACGANPGMISWLALQAIVNLKNDILPHVKDPQTQEEFATLARDLNIRVIHVAESDFQAPIIPKKPGEFVNTWSVDGFISEGVYQPAELGWGTHEKKMPHNSSHYPNDEVPAAIYLPRPGGCISVRSWTPRAGPYLGFLVTHNESISLSQFLSLPGTHGDRNVSYCPTVHYSYRPCDAAIVSLHEMFGSNSKQQKKQRIPLPHELVCGGVDELGVLLMGHAKGAYWFGSSLSIDRARKIAPYNTATSMQVVAGILAGMVYAIKHPHKGLIEAEQIPYKEALHVALPLLAPVSGHYSDWNPLKDRPQNLKDHPDLDPEDPWQFPNFIFHNL